MTLHEQTLSARDDEHALRLVLEVWLKDGKLTSAAFKTRGVTSPNYIPVSLFIEERLPGSNGDLLHVGAFSSSRRARLLVGMIRSASYVADGVERLAGFDLLLDGTADPPLEAFGAAHAQLQGPTQRPAAARALAEAFNQHGQLERAPD